MHPMRRLFTYCSIFLFSLCASTALAAPTPTANEAPSGAAAAQPGTDKANAANAAVPTNAQAATDQANKDLSVGITIMPPFVIKNADGNYSGLAIGLWQQIAKENQWTYNYTEYGFRELLTAVKNGAVDVAVTAITTTAPREQTMDFTHPMTSTGLTVAVRDTQRSGWLSVASALFSPAFLKIIGTLALLLLIVGILAWVLERHHNEDEFGGPKRHGIFTGFWWAMVTMTTVGYGDVSPRSVGGRILAMIWMLTALIITSFFTASITTALTVGQLSQQIQSADDLATMEVATVDGTTSADWLNHQNLSFQKTDTLDKALAELAAGTVDAVVYDAPLLKWDIKQHYRGKLQVLPITLERQDYAFALPPGSTLRQDINTALLRQINGPDWIEQKREYMQ